MATGKYINGDFDRNLKIGVLGGIGPEATGEYYSKLIGRLQQTGLIRDNTDFPQIFVNSIPAPELVHDEATEEQLSPYKTGLRELDKFGVNAIVMVCNTIHLYLPELQQDIRAPIMDLRQKVKEKMAKDGINVAAVIGTPLTIKNGLYRFEGVSYFELSEEEIMELGEAIFRYNKGEEPNAQKRFVEKLARKYLEFGADTIVLGCTEPAVMLKDVDIPKIDTLDVLVEGTVEFYRRMEAHRLVGLK